MKKSFAGRRVPRKIGQDDEEAASDVSSTNDSSAPSIVKRPSQKHRKSSALRASFASDDDPDDASSLITPKRSTLSRLAIQRNAEKRSDVPFRATLDSNVERPSYSRDYLDELKQSTPTTPRDVASPSATDTEASVTTRAVDIASKFGSDVSRYQPPTAIPTDSEIQEKKARRARLAKENDFISLEAEEEDEDEEDDAVTRDEEGRLILKPKEKYAETRLVREDEDMLEGFDDFTSDGKITFGRKAQKEEDQRRRAEMASLIANAEGESADGNDDEEDESEAERNAAFEVAQTRHGTYATRDQDEGSTRPQTPPKVVPIPTMDHVIERLRRRLQEMEMMRATKANEMASLVREKTQIGDEEVRVQTALKETGERYQNLREEMGLRAKDGDAQVAVVNGNQEKQANSTSSSSHEGSDGDDDDDELYEDRPGLGTAGLGLGGGGMRRDMADWGMP